MKARPTRPVPKRPPSLRQRPAVRLLLALVVGGACLPGLAAAAPDWRRSAQEALEPNTLVRPAGISVERCANIVRRETGGRVLSATPSERGGREGCDVRVLVDGKRVMNVFVDDKGRMRGG